MSENRCNEKLRSVAVVFFFLLTLGVGLPGSAEEESPEESGTKVELEKLLVLPSNLSYDVEKRGGLTRPEWASKFEKAEIEYRSATESLAKSQQEMEKLATAETQWQMGPPGTTANSDAPLSYQLRQEIKRQRTEVERAQRRLRELEVEANLAGVPEHWRHSARRESSSDSQP